VVTPIIPANNIEKTMQNTNTESIPTKEKNFRNPILLKARKVR
jgi:hypothetical protein